MPETFTIRGVPVFSVGCHNGDVYNEADLDHMVAAFARVGFRPPVKLGHDPSQPLAQSDGMPALGWVTNLTRRGTQLYADLIDLPKKVYEAITRKNYDRVSAEVYWDYQADGLKLPRVLKGLALLGADIPAVTSLAALETLYDAEGHGFKRYDMGMMPSASSPRGGDGHQWQNEHGDDDDDRKKDKEIVHYRAGGEDLDQDGTADYCGNCRFFCGDPDPDGSDADIDECSLVAGPVASSQLCDLYEIMEAFGSFSQREYAAKVTEKAWDGSKSRFDLEQLTRAVPDAVRTWAESQAGDGEVAKGDLKFPFKEPDGTINLNGVRAALAALGGARTGKGPNLPQTVIDKARKQLQAILAKHGGGSSDTKQSSHGSDEPHVASMAQEGSRMDDKDYADLQARLEAADTEKAALTAKVAELSQAASDMTTRANALEAEKTALVEQTRQAEKHAWFAANTLAANLKILPVERPLVEHLYDVLDAPAGTTIKAYTDAQGKSYTPMAAFRSLFESRTPGTMLFTELSQSDATAQSGTDQPDVKSLTISQAKALATEKAKSYMQEKGEKSFKVALDAVYAANPDLKDASAGITMAGDAKVQAGQAAFGRLFRQPEAQP